jgi:hypothetical protein
MSSFTRLNTVVTVQLNLAPWIRDIRLNGARSQLSCSIGIANCCVKLPGQSAMANAAMFSMKPWTMIAKPLGKFGQYLFKNSEKLSGIGTRW